MLRFIIVEGNECTGKTTLVEELRSELGWDTKDLTHRPGDQFLRYMVEYVNADRIVFNRSHYAEMVFSKLYRQIEPFSPEEIAALDLLVYKYGLIVYCDLAVAEIVPRLESRNEREVLNEDNTSYAELMSNAAVFASLLGQKHTLRYTALTREDLKAVIAKIQSAVCG
ncbi:MAG: hypothetical protein AAF702_02625 [Chloroflexota bacterium]